MFQRVYGGEDHEWSSVVEHRLYVKGIVYYWYVVLYRWLFLEFIFRRVLVFVMNNTKGDNTKDRVKYSTRTPVDWKIITIIRILLSAYFE